MKNITKVLSLALILSLTFLFSCKKDNDETPSGSTHKVVYKAVGSSGTNIGVAVVSTGLGATESFTSLSGSTWTSPEYTISSSAIVLGGAVNGTGPDANSTLTMQVWVDGVMKAEGKSTGQILSASTTFSFQQ